MNCYLTISGRNFDPAKFLKESRLASASEIWRHGDPLLSKWLQKELKRKTKPDSGFQIAASDGGNDHQIASQVRQAIRFLKRHRHDLKRLAQSSSVEQRRLRFAILWPRGIVSLGRVLPVELLGLASQFRIEIELAVYGATSWKLPGPLRKKLVHAKQRSTFKHYTHK